MTGVILIFIFVIAYFTGETPFQIFSKVMGEITPAWFTLVWIIALSIVDIANFFGRKNETNSQL